ncbi:MAG: WG repeat-containing protein [Terriglobia bacterium]|nr:WG repeat-containing protein [Terriglobia bacterium]
MAEESELQHIPRTVDTLVLSDARSSLIARGGNDAKAIMARKPEPSLRAKVKMNGKWGLIDKTGRFVVEPFCYEIRDSCCGMAAFSDVPVQHRTIRYNMGPGKPCESVSRQFGGCWGFVNGNWEIVVPANFKEARDFSEGLAAVLHNGKWGFLTKEGSFAIEPQFEEVNDFLGGMCLVKLDGRYGFIDYGGKLIVLPRFNRLNEFSEGLASAEIDKKWGFIDRTGEIVIHPYFDWASDFHGGMARAKLGGKVCLIDPKGSLIYQCSDVEEKLGGFADDVARVSGRYRAPLSGCSHDHPGCIGVCNDDPCSCPRASLVCELCSCDYGFYIDRAGTPIPMPKGLVGFGDFAGGLALVGDPHTRWEDSHTSYRFGYINAKGEVIIAPQFDSAEDFADGTARVYTDQEEWRLIDNEGNFLDAPDSDEHLHRIQGFTEKIGTEWETEFGFADVLGDVVIEPIYSDEDFREGIARVYTTRGQWRLINKLGIFVDTPESETSHSSKNDNGMAKDALVRFKSDGLYGFADQLGNVVIEPRFTWVGRFSNGMAIFFTKGDAGHKYGFLDRTGTIVIPPQFEYADNFEAVK